jgi:hypothetical protein
MRKFIITLFTALLFLVVGNAYGNQQKEIRVDNDVGISVMDNTDIIIETENCQINCINEAEVEISPGDQVVYVSSTANTYARKETLQGSYMIKNITEQLFDINNIRNWQTDTRSYAIQKEPNISKDHFRLDRSRCLINTGKIA